MKPRRTEIQIETDEIWIIRRPVKGFANRCPDCDDQTTMVTPDEAALLTKLCAPDINRFVEAGLVHYTTLAGGRVLICFNSIMKVSNQR